MKQYIPLLMLIASGMIVVASAYSISEPEPEYCEPPHQPEPECDSEESYEHSGGYGESDSCEDSGDESSGYEHKGHRPHYHSHDASESESCEHQESQEEAAEHKEHRGHRKHHQKTRHEISLQHNLSFHHSRDASNADSCEYSEGQAKSYGRKHKGHRGHRRGHEHELSGESSDSDSCSSESDSYEHPVRGFVDRAASGLISLIPK